MRRQNFNVLVGIAAVWLSGCGSSMKSSGANDRSGFPTAADAGAYPTASGNGTMAPGAGGTGGGALGADAIVALPPEKKLSVDFQLPQASDNYVYATNPSAGTVSVIDAQTLSIRTLPTGAKPTYLRTLKGSDNAVVLNIGSDTATVIRSTATASTGSDLPVVTGANAIGVTPDGHHAVVYYNSSYASAGTGSGSFQDVTVLTLAADSTDDEAVSMTVGFRPRDVFFANDSTRAFVITEDGVSVLDFAAVKKGGSGIAPLVLFGGGIDQKTLDVSVTPDGSYALARSAASSVLRLVELGTGKVRELDVAKAYVAPSATGDDAGVDDAGTVAAEKVPIIITDLELRPDGKAAVAALRNQSAMIILPLPGAFDDPHKATTVTVPGEIIGSASIAPDSQHALLYTTATSALRMTIVDLGPSPAPPQTVALRKAVQAVVFTPDSQTAFITHTKVPGATTDVGLTPDQVIDRSYGYSLLRVSNGFVKLQVTQTAVGPVAMVPDFSCLFILFRDDTMGIKEVHRVSLSSLLTNPITRLESPPISLGPTNVSSGKVFVNQDHPDGRMTFIDWKDPTGPGGVKTVTGFALNSRIRN